MLWLVCLLWLGLSANWVCVGDAAEGGVSEGRRKSEKKGGRKGVHWGGKEDCGYLLTYFSVDFFLGRVVILIL